MAYMQASHSPYGNGHGVTLDKGRMSVGAVAALVIAVGGSCASVAYMYKGYEVSQKTTGERLDAVETAVKGVDRRLVGIEEGMQQLLKGSPPWRVEVRPGK